MFQIPGFCRGFFLFPIFVLRHTSFFITRANTLLVVGKPVQIRRSGNTEVCRYIDQPSYFMRVDKEGLNDDNDEDFSGIINKMKDYLLENYEPVQDPRDADFHFSTREIYMQLLKLCPNEYILKEETVANWLHLGGFTFHDYGELRLDWMVKKR
jgi:hypothetical protein